MRKSLLALATVSALACGAAQASIDIYAAVLLGANEVPGPGDPDGFGGATVLIDNVTNEVSWSILANNIDPASAAHIHSAPAGVAGPVIIDFAGMFNGVVVDSDAAMINPGNSMDFYVNVHNPAFPGGAIRGQLVFVTTAVPETESYALMLAGLGLVGWLARRRRA